jgi:hypothetical protein
MTKRFITTCIFVAALGWFSAVVAGAADAPAAGGDTSAEKGDLVGPLFESPSGGIAFRPPVDCEQVTTGTPDEVATFVNDKTHWVLRCSSATLTRPVPLASHEDPFHQTKQEGMLELTLAKLKEQQPGAEILRSDILHVGKDGEISVGMIALRYSLGTDRRLTQQAIVAATDKLYYVLDLTSPARPVSLAADVEDPEERAAVETFSKVVDSLLLVDRGKIFDDQVARLIRTRALFVQWNSPHYLESRLVPEQWLRLLRDGKDIGYTYIVQELDTKEQIAGQDQIRIGIRSHTVPIEGMTVDAETWQSVTLDRKREYWTSIAIRKGKDEGSLREIGIGEQMLKPVALPQPKDSVMQVAPDNNMGQRGIELKERHTLTVKRIARQATGEPFVQEPPAWYIPQAIGQLLPQILDLKQQKTYMFATYISEPRPAIANRYIDVGPIEEVTLNGKKVTGVGVRDHIGLEGPVTTHYMDPISNQYLGSICKYVGPKKQEFLLVVVPTDADTLKKIWENADLSRPERPAEEPPQGQAPGASTGGTGTGAP